MAIRIITGIFLAAAVCLLIYYLPSPALKGVIALIAAVGIHEVARMILPKHPSSSESFTIVLGTALCLAVMFAPKNSGALLIALPLVLLATFTFYLFRHQSLDLVLNQVATTFLAAVYAGLLLAFLGLLRDLPEGSAWLLLVLATTFGADTGAYFSGRLFGRIRLASRVSPGKTVEGLLGGLFASIGVAFLCRLLFFKDLSFFDCVATGSIVGLVGPLGDLSESLLKRSVGVKDSGHLIPGHGGLLDRVDALLFTSPVVYYYAAFLRS